MRWATLLVMLCVAADCEQARLEALDAGRMTMADGTEMRPAVLPWVVVVDESIGSDVVDLAARWWNLETGAVLFEVDDGASPQLFGTLEVSMGYAGGDEYGPAGVFRDETNLDGEILRGSIVISSDIAYHEATVFDAIRHELGHALGLADDPHSIDLDSIMSSPLMPGAGLTEHDRDLILGAL